MITSSLEIRLQLSAGTSSGGVELSLGVSNLNRLVGGSAVRATHRPSSPGAQLNSSLLFQQEAPSAASPSLRTAVFLSLPAVPRAVSRFHTDCAGSPRHPTSAGSSHACPPSSLHCWSRVQISEASRSACVPKEARRFNQDDHVTMSSLRKVWTGPPSSPTCAGLLVLEEHRTPNARTGRHMFCIAGLNHRLRWLTCRNVLPKAPFRAKVLIPPNRKQG